MSVSWAYDNCQNLSLDRRTGAGQAEDFWRVFACCHSSWGGHGPLITTVNERHHWKAISLVHFDNGCKTVLQKDDGLTDWHQLWLVQPCDQIRKELSGKARGLGAES